VEMILRVFDALPLEFPFYRPCANFYSSSRNRNHGYLS
jgi:hypothetical protein